MTTDHLLSASDVDALARGAGGPGVIARMRTHRQIKHILMVAGVMRLAADRVDSATLANLEAGYRLLSTVQAAAPARFAELVGHPQVGLWAARCLSQMPPKRPAAAGDDLGRIVALGAVTAIRAGRAFELTTSTRDGCVFLPTLGLARIAPPGHDGLTTIRGDGTRTEITGAEGRVAVPADPTSDAPGWLGIRLLSSVADGKSIVIEFDDLDPDRDGLGRTLTGRLEPAEFARWQAALDEAWDVLVKDHAHRAEELAAGMRAIVPCEGSGRSVTSQYGFGSAVMSRPRDGVAMADTMIHEFQHSKLYALLDQVPLYEADAGTLHYAPWRADPRPLGGILQGVYAFIGVTEFWHHQRFVTDAAHRDRAHFEFARWRGQVLRAAETLLDSGRLTEPGVHFVQSLRAHATGWMALPVPDEIGRLADAAVADHGLVWRLNNVRPDRAVVDAITTAWLAGEPCPVDPTATSGLVQPSDADVCPNGRLQIALRSVRTTGSPAGPDVVAFPADVALVARDYPRAARLYEEQMARDPGDVVRFAGLIQAVAHTTPPEIGAVLAAAPEVVFAVYTAIRDACGGPPRPAELFTWLGG